MLALVTKIQDIKDAGVQEVALSGFVPKEPFVVKLCRPSLMRLAQEGEIPNQLLGPAAQLFNEGAGRMMKDGEKFVELSKAVIMLAKAALVEPSYDDLQAAGIELTDAQLMDIYLYTQQGVRSLAGFRPEQEPEQNIEPSGSTGKRARGSNGD